MAPRAPTAASQSERMAIEALDFVKAQSKRPVAFATDELMDMRVWLADDEEATTTDELR